MESSALPVSVVELISVRHTKKPLSHSGYLTWESSGKVRGEVQLKYKFVSNQHP